MRCSKCGSENSPTYRFCAHCGASFPAVTATQPEGERRHLTVLFSDLVGSTEIASRLDAEEWRDLVTGYQNAAAGAIERCGGYVAQFLGDGLLAYFGYPEAHENDAERATRSGLAIIDAVVT